MCSLTTLDYAPNRATEAPTVMNLASGKKALTRPV